MRAATAVGQNIASNAVVTRRKGYWAVGADAKINLLSLAPGDALYFLATYGNGLIDDVTGGNQVNGSVAKDGRITGGWQPAIANVTGTATYAVVYAPARCRPGRLSPGWLHSSNTGPRRCVHTS